MVTFYDIRQAGSFHIFTHSDARKGDVFHMNNKESVLPFNVNTTEKPEGSVTRMFFAERLW